MADAISDEEMVVLELFELSNEASRLAHRATELALRLDQIAGEIGERWQPAVLDRIEEDDRRELAAERSGR